MKKIIVLSLVIFSSNAVFSHCGTCSVSNKTKGYAKKRHSHDIKSSIKSHKTHYLLSLKNLNLSDDQKQKYKTIKKNYHNELTTLTESANNKIKEILTTDQIQTLNESSVQCIQCDNESK